MPRKAIVVEDDEEALQRIEMVLECGNFDVRSARSVGVGITLLMEDKPDILILDYNLPDSKGGTMLEKIMSFPQYKDLPVLILTSESDPDLAQRLLAMGASSFITKTESNAVILNTVERLTKGVTPAAEEPQKKS